METFGQEQRGVALGMIAAVVVSVVVLGIAFTIDRARMPLAFEMRLRAALRGDLLVVVWLAAAIANVARLRFFSPDDIGGSSGDVQSAGVRNARAVLQNTLEQVVLAIGTQMILVATVGRSACVVAALTYLFAAGRLAFWLGYARGARARAFGFGLTFYPAIIALAAAAVLR